MSRERRRGCFLPQPDGDSRCLPSGTARALSDGSAARSLSKKAGEACAAIIARPSGETAVDDNPNVLERDAGLGDAGGEDELALALGRRSERSSLCRRLDAAMQFVKLDIGWKPSEHFGGPLDLGDAGEKGKQRSRVLGKRGADRRTHLRLNSLGGVAAGVADVQGEALALADDRRRIIEQALEPVDIERCRHGEEPDIVAKCA
jgi:hypothetical protein